MESAAALMVSEALERTRTFPRIPSATVMQAHRKLTMYLWVEREQIPHLRVMGRNIRVLKSELEPFCAAFRFEVGYGRT
jgi:hypothetical protein